MDSNLFYASVLYYILLLIYMIIPSESKLCLIAFSLQWLTKTVKMSENFLDRMTYLSYDFVANFELSLIFPPCFCLAFLL